MGSSEGTQTTYEQATRCPKCKNPGQVIKKEQAGPELPYGTQRHVVQCRTEVCVWFATDWIVQVNPDGSVPPDQTEKHKADAAKAALGMPIPSDDQLELIRNQYRGLGTHGNEEWPNPHGR